MTKLFRKRSIDLISWWSWVGHFGSTRILKQDALLSKSQFRLSVQLNFHLLSVGGIDPPFAKWRLLVKYFIRIAHRLFGFWNSVTDSANSVSHPHLAWRDPRWLILRRYHPTRSETQVTYKKHKRFIINNLNKRIKCVLFPFSLKFYGCVLIHPAMNSKLALLKIRDRFKFIATYDKS